MTTPVDVLRASARMLSNEADKLEGKTPGTTYFGQALTPAQEAERERIERAFNFAKPHAYVAPAPGVPPDQTGTNELPPASYESHKIMWQAGQRGDPVTPGGERILTNGIPGWPDANGRPFRIDDYLPLGPDAIHAAIGKLWVSPTAQAWLESVGPTWPALKRQPTRW